MRIYRHIPWPILLSASAHLTLATCLLMQTTVRAPQPIHVVHMHLMAAEQHAAHAAAMSSVVQAEAAVTKQAPKPKLAVPRPRLSAQPKLQPLPRKLPAAATPPLSLPIPRPATAGLALAAKPEDTAPKTVKPLVAATQLPSNAAAPSLASSAAGDGDDQLDGGDQSAEALLIHSTVIKPEYTTEALFARLEGLFPMNINIDATGRVVSAQLAKKVGFGMDQRILAAIREARFQPGHDAHGQPRGGWVKIKFKLEIPE